jgi:hypothetical protein
MALVDSGVAGGRSRRAFALTTVGRAAVGTGRVSEQSAAWPIRTQCWVSVAELKEISSRPRAAKATNCAVFGGWRPAAQLAEASGGS